MWYPPPPFIHLSIVGAAKILLGPLTIACEIYIHNRGEEIKEVTVAWLYTFIIFHDLWAEFMLAVILVWYFSVHTRFTVSVFKRDTWKSDQRRPLQKTINRTRKGYGWQTDSHLVLLRSLVCLGCFLRSDPLNLYISVLLYSIPWSGIFLLLDHPISSPKL